MTVELTKQDLISLVTAVTEPEYSIMQELEKKRYGKFYGGFSHDWVWNKTELEELTEQQLWEIYQRCKGKR